MFLVAFLSLKQANIEGEFCVSYGKASWRSITWRIRVLEYFKTLCQTWQGIAKTISSKMEENRAFRKAKSSISQGMPKFGKVCQNLVGCAKLSQGVPTGCAKISQGVWKSLCAHRPSGFFSRIVIFPFYSFCNR